VKATKGRFRVGVGEAAPREYIMDSTRVEKGWGVAQKERLLTGVRASQEVFSWSLYIVAWMSD
jgi:hypothetical protein